MSLTSTIQKVMTRLSEYGVRVFRDSSDNALVQAVLILDSSGNIVSSFGGNATAATQTSGTVSGAATLLPADTARLGGYIQAAWANTDNIYISLNSPATSSDIPLAPGGQFHLTLNYGGRPISNAIYGIAGSGTQSYRIITA